MDNQQRICKAGDKCHWPRGPKQPLHRFVAIPDRGEKIYYQYCVSCRAHKARLQAEIEAKRAAGSVPGPKPRRRKKHNNLPSNSVITPEQQQAIRGWLLGLVIRRAGNDGENNAYYAHHSAEETR